MSLESKIDTLTVVINALNQNLGLLLSNAPAGPAIAPQTAQATVPQPVAPAPVQPVMPEVPSFAPPAAAMPPLPSFAAPVAPAAPAVPFNDGPSMVAYVTKVYGELGPEKGAQIQNVISSLGVTNINEIKPEQYGALYAGIQALKG